MKSACILILANLFGTDARKLQQFSAKTSKSQAHVFNMSQIEYPTTLAPRGQEFSEYVAANGTKVKVFDPYRYMEDTQSPKVKAWVDQQNKLTDQFLEQCELREKFKKTITENWNYPRVGIPSKHGDHYYFGYNSGLMPQTQWYKIKEKGKYTVDPNDPLKNAEMFMDPNQMYSDGKTAMGQTYWSDDGKYMAYAEQKGGSDWKTIYVRDVSTGKNLENDELMWIKFSGISWNKNSKGFFYSRYEVPKSYQEKSKKEHVSGKQGKETDKLQNMKIYYHRIGQNQSQDTLLFEYPQIPTAMVNSHTTHDGNYLMIRINQGNNGRYLLYYADLQHPDNQNLDKKLSVKPVVSEWIASYDYVHNIGKTFYMQTDYNAPMNKIVKFEIDQPAFENWVDVIPEHPRNVLQQVQSMKNGTVMLANYLENASEKIKVFDFNTPSKLIKEIDMPGYGAVPISSGGHHDYEWFFKFQTFTDPGSIYRLDMNSYEVEVLRRPQLQHLSLNISDFTTDQAWFQSKDGTKVPMFIIRKKAVLPSLDQEPEKPIPTILHGYGGFGNPETPKFSLMDLIFLNNLNGLYVVANIRGGGEFGKQWHMQAVQENRQKSFDDFIAAAEYLQQKGYTDSKHLVTLGGSNGGTLVAVTANQRPELFAAAIPQVPVTDMFRFHKFTGGHFWQTEYGYPDKNGSYDFLINYSPLHNVKKQKYPAMLITTGDHDDRVVPLHSYKYVAELQYQAGSSMDVDHPILVRVNVDQGHSGGGTTTSHIQEMTDLFGFIAKITKAQWVD